MMNFFQNIPTELHLNGPNVGFSSLPIDASATITGVATFTAIGTASFPYNNVGGSFSFDWYFDDQIIQDTFVDPNSNASIVTDGSLGISTITISGLTGSDDKKKVYAVVNYVPGPDENIVDYPGEGKGRAISRDQQTATLTAPPTIVIRRQPNSVNIGSGNTATFSVDAFISRNLQPLQINAQSIPELSYRWQLEGQDLSNGTISRSVQNSDSEFPTMTVTSDAGDDFTLDWSDLTTFDSFAVGRTYTLKTSESLTALISAAGAGGGRSSVRSVAGGSGGSASGTFTFVKDREYKLRVGGAGQNAGSGGFSGGGNGGGGHGAGGGGGGFTGLFLDSVTHDNAILIAGGGGGGANDPAQGGSGGGLIGGNSSNGPGPRGGGGGTQDSAGSGGSGGGGKLQGGPGAAGGGGGYWGGAGGNPFPGCCADGGGGGGSSYVGGAAVAQGQAAFTTPGTHNWTAPSGTTSVSVVCVGGGGAGSAEPGGIGGYGGGLGWKNNIPVVSGQTYAVVVGAGGKSKTSGKGGNGGDSYFIDLTTVAGLGGPGGNSSGMSTTGGSFVGDGGGLGGGTESKFLFAHAGGGAGGYTGNGGFARSNNSGTPGEGGGGGAGQDGGGSSGNRGAGGGGVGILGQGENGNGGGKEGERIGKAGKGGSGGSDGQNSGNGGAGGSFGGGGGQSANLTPGSGAGGAVRIIWGPNREFPSTNTEDLPESSDNVVDGESTLGGGADPGADGSFSITRISSFKTINTTVSGADTDTLKVYSDDENFGGALKCVLTANNIINSPLESKAVSYDVVPARNMIQIEGYSVDNEYASTFVNLDEVSFKLDANTFGSKFGVIQFHATEKDIDLRLDMRAAAGSPQRDGFADGGEGGTSVITLKAERDVEYTVIGISNNSALFLYRKANLIAVIGKGGNGGVQGRGGQGGGANVDGQEGRGNNGRRGSGSEVITPNLTGTFGSIVQNYSVKPDLYVNDTIAEGTDGGQTVSCSKGRFFVEQGISPCSDISTGEIQFTNIDGTTIPYSSTLYRGFKAGYTVTETGGAAASLDNNGNGGSGVQGGGGGQTGTTGGGGGSGYADSSVTVVSTRRGGNTDTSSFIYMGLRIPGEGRTPEPPVIPEPDRTTQTVNFTITMTGVPQEGQYPEGIGATLLTMILKSGSGPTELSLQPESDKIALHRSISLLPTSLTTTTVVTASILSGSRYEALKSDGLVGAAPYDEDTVRLNDTGITWEAQGDPSVIGISPINYTITPDKGRFTDPFTYVADFQYK